jgi:hypothetical protein
MTQGPEVLFAEISQIVARTVVDTFNGMFGQSVITATVDREPGEAANRTTVGLVLKNEKGLPARFYFSFDDHMLSLTALNFFSTELSADPAIRIDIASAVANIVGTKVKNCLNENGYKFEMTFPYPVLPGELAEGQEALHMHFAYNDATGQKNEGGVTVDFLIRDRKAAGGSEYLH